MANRTLEIKVKAENKDLKKGLEESRKEVSVFESGVKKAGVALAGAFAAGAVINGLKNLVVQLGNTADRLLDLQDITGMTTTKLQEYEHVARVAGVNSEFMATAVQNMTMRMARGEGETSPLNRGLKALGINMKDASGELRNGADVTEEAITALAAMDNITERNVIGAQMFAGAWKDLAPVLALGADGIEAARKEAHEMGLVMDRSMLEKANEARINMEKLDATTRKLGQELAMAFVPALNAVTSALTDTLTGMNNFINANKVLNASETLSWWDKLRTKAQLLFGAGTAAIGGATMLGKGLSTLSKAQNEYNETLDESLNTSGQAGAAAVVAIEKLGQIGQLQADIKSAEAGYIAANSDAERAVWLNRKKALEEELSKLEAIARIRAMASGAPIAATPTSGSGLQVATPTDTLSPIVTKQISNLAILKARIEETSYAMMDWQAISVQAGLTIGNSLMQMAADGKIATSELIKQLTAQITGHLIASIMSNSAILFPANIALAAGAGLFAGSLMNSIPAFADGGQVNKPTLAMFGEYPGAASNPEYALRQDQLKKMMSGSGKLAGEFVVRGKDLVLVLNETQRRRNV